MRFVDAAGTSVHYQTAGTDEGAALTFLFLHGAAFTSATWVENGVLEAVSVEDFRSIAIDLPGYGQSSPTDLTNEHVVPEIMAALHLDATKTIIVAPSISGTFILPSFQRGSLRDLAGFVGVAPVGSADFAASLSEPLSVRALAVWGDGDGADPRGQAEALARAFASSEVVVVPDAGHAAYNQQPALFAALLLDFARSIVA
ncbi:MAG: alpha/beta hydrolase [Acidimicrobiales bacterium]